MELDTGILFFIGGVLCVEVARMSHRLSDIFDEIKKIRLVIEAAALIKENYEK